MGVLTRTAVLDHAQTCHDKRRQQLPQPSFRRGGIGFLNFLFHTASLRQALAQAVADTLNDHNGHEQYDQDMPLKTTVC